MAAIIGVSAAACGGKGAVAPGQEGVEVRSTVVTHEPCESSGSRVEAVDVNGDGKPDVTKVYASDGKEKCRVTDLNYDGKVDMYEYFGPGGESDTRRREASYVESGDITSIEYFENGKRVRRELDTTGQRRIDTWDTFDAASGKRTKRERDVNGDGKIDQWWAFEGEKTTIAIDRNGDGRPDPEATIVTGGPDPSAKPGPTTDAGGDARAKSDGASPAAATPPPADKPAEEKPAEKTEEKKDDKPAAKKAVAPAKGGKSK